MKSVIHIKYTRLGRSYSGRRGYCIFRAGGFALEEECLGFPPQLGVSRPLSIRRASGGGVRRPFRGRPPSNAANSRLPARLVFMFEGQIVKCLYSNVVVLSCDYSFCSQLWTLRHQIILQQYYQYSRPYLVYNSVYRAV